MSDRNDRPRIRRDERDLVGDLLSIADSGPEIPADGADRIKAAIKTQWRRDLRARARRRWTIAAAGVAAAAILAVAVTTLDRSDRVVTRPTGPVAYFDVVDGRVEVVSADGRSIVSSELDLPRAIAAGSWIRTAGESRAGLRLGEGQSLRLDVDTSIRLASTTRVDLERGAAYLDSRDANGSPVDIATPFGIASDVGTQFEVRLTEGLLSVAVREGVVAINRDDLDLEVGSGVAVTVSADGRIDRRRIDPSSGYWTWVQEIAPPFDIEGRSVADFLGWVSRETGSLIRYSEPGLERFARDTVLHGTAAGLSPIQAPDVVLASCGLIAEKNGEFLVVRRDRVPSR